MLEFIREGFVPPPDNLFKVIDHNLGYFKNGEWKSCFVFGNTLANLELISSNPIQWLELIQSLKSAGVVGCSLEHMSEGIEVPTHTDTDVLLDYPVIRMFYSLSSDNSFYFKGSVFSFSSHKFEEVELEEWKDFVMFSAHRDHSFKSHSDGYYFIIDLAQDPNKLDTRFWKHYLSLVLDNYVV